MSTTPVVNPAIVAAWPHGIARFTCTELAALFGCELTEPVWDRVGRRASDRWRRGEPVVLGRPLRRGGRKPLARRRPRPSVRFVNDSCGSGFLATANEGQARFIPNDWCAGRRIEQAGVLIVPNVPVLADFSNLATDEVNLTKTKHYWGYYAPLVALAAVGLLVADVLGAGPSGPTTLWKVLGIPQGAQRLRDGTANRNGNNPQWERKPPVKRIADPENLDPKSLAGKNPAINAAANVKAQEDLAKQKIKAVKYLAQIGCGCYPEAKPALLAAMDDCTEEVRFEAVKAFCRASGDPCKVCNKGTCCDAEVMSKLAKIAREKDAQGCYKEPSQRVRAAAELALQACQRVTPPTPAPVSPVPIKELPGQADADAPDGSEPGVRAKAVGYSLAEPAGDGPSSSAKDLTQPPAERLAARRCPPVRRGFGFRSRGGGVICPPSSEMPAPGAGAEATAPGEVAPEPTPQQPAPEMPPSPSPESLAGDFGAAAGPQSVAPAMIGDFFGGGSSRSSIVRTFTYNNLPTRLAGLAPGPGAAFLILQKNNGTDVANAGIVFDPGGGVIYPPVQGIVGVNDAAGGDGSFPFNRPNPDVPAGGTFLGGTARLVPGTGVDPPKDSSRYDAAFRMRYLVDIPNPGSGGVVGRLKIAENTSPMPRDRLIFDYSYFDSVPLFPGGVDVSRFVVGVEKTFLGGLASLELKVPMAVTLDSDIVSGGSTDYSHAEFGNLMLTLKGLMLRRQAWAFSSGMAVTVPTADDVRVAWYDGTPLVNIDNESVHLMPFIGLLFTPNDRFFAQAFLQYDVDTNGCPVAINTEGTGLLSSGRVNDATFQFLDIGIGYWSLPAGSGGDCLTGVAWTGELHWNQSLGATDTITNGAWTIGDFSRNISNWDLTLGCHLELRDLTTLTLAYVTPLGGGSDRQFDGEFRLMLNRRFGPQTRATRTPTTL